jgi:hypothetical protein
MWYPATRRRGREFFSFLGFLVFSCIFHGSWFRAGECIFHRNTFLNSADSQDGKSHSVLRHTRRAMPPARARARRSLMADDDEPPTASTSALRSAWVDDPPFPPLPSAARNVSPAEVVVDAVAVMPAEGPAGARLRSIERRTSAGRRPPSTSSCSGATKTRIRSSNSGSTLCAREEAGVRGARVRQCGSGGGGSDGSYLCTRHRRQVSLSLRLLRCDL